MEKILDDHSKLGMVSIYPCIYSLILKYWSIKDFLFFSYSDLSIRSSSKNFLSVSSLLLSSDSWCSDRLTLIGTGFVGELDLDRCLGKGIFISTTSLFLIVLLDLPDCSF